MRGNQRFPVCTSSVAGNKCSLAASIVLNSLTSAELRFLSDSVEAL